MAASPHRRVVVAITGATGVPIGVRTLEILAGMPDVHTHLVLSSAGVVTLRQESDRKLADLTRLADETHRIGAIGDSIASGSYPVDAMLVTPCSIKTLSAIAHCHTDNLITRAADVTLKEGRPLLLAVREAPLHRGHLRLMDSAAEAGAIIMPPMPAFYPRPHTVDAIVDHLARRALVRVGFAEAATPPWLGLNSVDAVEEM